LGSDILNGGAGSDTLDGGAGADTMIGGVGPDIYTVDNVGDTIVENSNDPGVDLVNAYISYTLPVGVEDGSLHGAGLTPTGNNASNTVTANDNDCTLTGLGGADHLIARGDNDLLIGGAGADILDGGLGPNFADYSASPSAISVDLVTHTASGGDAEGD